MKIKFIAIALLLASVPIIYASIPKEKTVETKKHYSEESIKFLADMGLTSSKTVTDNVDLIDYTLKKAYLKEYGVSYFSTVGLTALMKSQGLVMGEMKSFIGEIPESNINEFKANYERLKPAPQWTNYYVDDSEAGIVYIPQSAIKPDMFRVLEEYPRHGVPWAGTLLKENAFRGAATVGISKEPHLLPGPKIKIVAPEKHFNMEGKTVDENNNVVTKKVDPMIIMERDGGWLALTSWFN